MNTRVPEQLDIENQEARVIFNNHLAKGYARTSTIFVYLLPVQWFAFIFIAFFVSPYIWQVDKNAVNIHVWAAFILGGIITILPAFLAYKFPRETVVRHVVAASQLLMSALLIYLTGGRIETHLHVYGSIAFLSLYRDWKIFIPASAITIADHVIRGWLYPQSIYGVSSGAEWRWIEHSAWLMLLCIVLMISCRNSVKKLWEIANDAAESNRNKLSLYEARDFLKNVINSVPNLIFVKDETGRYILVNDAYAELYGYKNEEIVGSTDADLMTDQVKAEEYRLDDQRILDTWKDKVMFEEVYTDADGKNSWFDAVKRPIVDNFGRKRIVGICTNVTERKTLESQLRHSQKLESIGQLAAGIAHEINTPTQYVGDNTRFIQDSMGEINEVLDKYVELLAAAKRGDVSTELILEVESEINRSDIDYIREEVPNAISQSLEGISRIAKIVQSMKDFAHPGTGAKIASDINKAIESTITVASNEWKYIAEMDMNFDDSIPPVPVLLGEINQVILNMVTNASHAIADIVGDGSNGKGRITITTTKANDEWAEIRIADTGTGIPEELKTRIFDPFFTTKEVGKGSGQGLAISHSVIVDKHAGKIDVESETGKGTTFIIRLPLKAESGLSTDGDQAL